MDGIPENSLLIPHFSQPASLRSGPSGRTSLPEALQPLEEVDRPPGEKILAAFERRLLLIEGGLPEGKEDEGVIRTRTTEETRRFPGFDEKTETEETVLEQGGQTKFLGIRVARQQIAREPEEAAAAQANLDPTRLRALLFD